MTRDEAHALVGCALGQVAPEIDLAAADEDAKLQEEFDLDSVGFLTVIEILHERTGLELPERDYLALSSVRACVSYLLEHTA